MRKVFFLLSIISLFLVSCANAPVTEEHLVLEATEVSVQIFEIPANQKWGNTRIAVRKGEELHISYLSGTITDGDTAISDANGNGYVCGHTDCCEPLPSVPRDALIGRVGNQIFYIGNGSILEMPATGHLYLRVNDCDTGLYDNQGQLSIIIFPTNNSK